MVSEACEALGVSEAGFHKLRSRFLRDAVGLMEPKKPGRKPAEVSPEEERIEDLLSENRDLKTRLAASEIRTEIALVMPHLLKDEARQLKKNAKAREKRQARQEETITLPPAGRRLARHVKRIESACAVQNINPGHKWGMRRQEETRSMERTIRKRAVAFARSKGVDANRAAAHLGLRNECLQSWQREWREHRLKARARGRPPVRSDRETRQAILHTLHDLGPETGIPTLQGGFPQVPKRELENILWRFREHYRLTHSPLAHELAWTKPGRKPGLCAGPLLPFSSLRSPWSRVGKRRQTITKAHIGRYS